MQPTLPKPSSPGSGSGHSGPSHPEVNYTAPEFGHDSSTPGHHPDYEFIMNPGAAPAKKLFLPSGGSPLTRIALVLGGLLVLLILFVVVKNLLGGHHSNVSSFTAVAQEQQVLIAISKSATAQQAVSTITKNSSATISTTITSAQQQLIAYMKTNGQKVSTATLNLRVQPSTDAQLTAATAAGAYDATYKTVVTTALGNYQQALKQAYAQTTGPKGRALLSDQYKGAQLLVQQLGT